MCLKKVKMCILEVAYKQIVSVFKKIHFIQSMTWTWPQLFLELFTFNSYIIQASGKQLQPMKTVIFTDLHQKLNLGMEVLCGYIKSDCITKYNRYMAKFKSLFNF